MDCDIGSGNLPLEAPPRLELGVKALQASALPLGYGALRSKRAAQALLEFVLERKTRFELATFALARRRSTTEPLPHVVRAKGLEPSRHWH